MSAVRIQKGPEQLEYRTFPVGEPPTVQFLDHGIRGCCQANMTATCRILTSQLRERPGALFVTVAAIRINTELMVRIWTEEGSPPEVLQHEEAHRAIARHYYGLTGAAALRAATPLVGRRIDLSMTAANEKAVGIIENMKEQLLAEIYRETERRCDVAQELFDNYTFEQPADAIPGALERAIAEETRAYEERQGARQEQVQSP